MSNSIQTKTVEHVDPSQASAVNPSNATSLTTAHAAAICGAVLALCFFLPWIDFFGMKASGFDLQKQVEGGRLLWGIPIFALITLVANMTKQSRGAAGLLAGLLPFGLLAYLLSQHGMDFLKVIAFGGWLSLLAAGLIIIFSTK